MSHASNRTAGDAVREFLSVADLLKEPQLARLYATVVRDGESTVRELMETLDLPQGTAYTYVNRLADAGILERTNDSQPGTYAAREIDLTVTTANGDHEYTITPALVDAVSRRTVDDDIDAFIDRHGIAALATALTYAVDRERGAVTHRLMARDLDLSPLAAELILQALRPVVDEHFDVEPAGASLDELEDLLEAEAADDET